VFEDSWIKTIYFDLPPPDRKKFKLAVFDNKTRLPEGTLARLRRSTGVNFSKAPVVENLELPALAEHIREFANLNSSEKPDQRSNSGGSTDDNQVNKPDVRFAIHHLTVLHDQYLIDHPDHHCSYRTFVRWWPTNIVKPDLKSRRTCHCRACENSAMKMDSLKKHEVISISSNIFLALKIEREGEPDLLDTLMDDIKMMKAGPRKEEIVTYSKWEEVEKEIGEEARRMRIEKGIKRVNKKVPVKIPKTVKVASLAAKCDSFRTCDNSDFD
jgi:hypothetical protein